jgi:hypothetical protein
MASDPREDTAKENHICNRKQQRDENKRPDTSMFSVLCPREERMVSDPRKDAAKGGSNMYKKNSRRRARIRVPTRWCVRYSARERSGWRAIRDRTRPRRIKSV